MKKVLLILFFVQFLFATTPPKKVLFLLIYASSLKKFKKVTTKDIGRKNFKKDLKQFQNMELNHLN